MKKKRSTDSILKDIFDQLAGPDAPEAHPVTRLLDEETKPAPDFLIETALPKAPAPGLSVTAPSEKIRWAVPAISALAAALAMLAFFGYDTFRSRDEAFRVQQLLETRRRQLALFEQKAAAGGREIDNLTRQVSDAGRERQNLLAAADFLKAAAYSTSPRLAPALGGFASIERRQVWLEQFQMKDKKVSVRGFTLDPIFLYKFSNELNASPYFSNARVVSTDEFKEKGRRTYAFLIEALLNESE